MSVIALEEFTFQNARFPEKLPVRKGIVALANGCTCNRSRISSQTNEGENYLFIR
jgi:hypothetical protein